MTGASAAVPSLRAFCLGVLGATTLAGKLDPPPAGLADDDLRAAALPALPGRPPGLQPSRRRVVVPSLRGYPDPAQRARLLHSWFNHELQAVELFAWALLRFTDAPAAFRRGLLVLLADEQRHALLYLGRLAASGVAPGDLPVSAYLWGKRRLMDSPRRFVAAMCLLFENANLDHSLDGAVAARAAGDEATARVLEQVHREEVDHVAFGLAWLRRFLAPGEDLLSAWRGELVPPLRPALGRGPVLHLACRRALGLPEDLLAHLAAAIR